MRIAFKLNYLLIGIVVLVVVILAVLFIKPNHSQTAFGLPQSIQYALEYFNAVNTNSTVLVPQEYYSAAKSLSINNNNVVSNSTEYNSILFGNATLPKGEFILIDMSQLSYLSNSSSSALSGLTKNLTQYSVNYTVENLTSAERNCLYFNGSGDSMALCQFYLDGIRIGRLTLVSFPGSSAYIANASVIYNGENYTYIPSDINSSSTNFVSGIDFIYGGNFNVYLPKALMSTFYGREMFLPQNMLNNVVDSIGEARIIKG